jgi:hypothetical protein
VLEISPAVPARQNGLAAPIAPEPQTTSEISRSQFARIRALAKYGMTVAQVAQVYGVAVDEIERILRRR